LGPSGPACAAWPAFRERQTGANRTSADVRSVKESGAATCWEFCFSFFSFSFFLFFLFFFKKKDILFILVLFIFTYLLFMSIVYIILFIFLIVIFFRNLLGKSATADQPVELQPGQSPSLDP